MYTVHTAEKYLTALHDNMLQVNTSLKECCGVSCNNVVVLSPISEDNMEEGDDDDDDDDLDEII